MRCQWKRPCWLNLRWKIWWMRCFGCPPWRTSKSCSVPMRRLLTLRPSERIRMFMHITSTFQNALPRMPYWYSTNWILHVSNICQSDPVFSYSFRISACYVYRCLMSAWSNQSTRLCMLCTFHEGVLPGQQQKLSQPFPGLSSQETLEQFLTPRTSFRS